MKIQDPIESSRWDKASRFIEMHKGRNLYKLDPELLTDNAANAMNYLRSLNDTLEIRCGAKVLLMGDGGSGKTSLAYLWATGKPIDNPRSTHGIVITEAKANLNGEHCVLRIWDFGGQNIYRPFHALFFSDKKFCDKAICVIILDAWKEESPEEWLHYVDTFAQHSHVFLVLNKTDERPRADLDTTRYLKERQNLVSPLFKLSCRNPQDGIMPPRIFFETVEKTLLKHLNDYQVQYQKAWVDIWDETVKQCREGKKYLSRESFAAICIGYGINEESMQNTILHTMNRQGMVLTLCDNAYHSYVLDPNWVADGLYKLLDANIILDDNLTLSFDRIKEIVQVCKETDKRDERYNNDEAICNLLGILVAHKLCLEPVGSQREYFIPALLSVKKPVNIQDTSKWLTFVYELDFLPPSLIHQFMISCWEKIQTHIPVAVWRYGAALNFTDEHAPEKNTVVIVEAIRSSIYLHTDERNENQEQRWNALLIIRHEIETLLERHGIKTHNIRKKVKIFVKPNKYSNKNEEYIEFKTLLNLYDMGRDRYSLPNSLHEIDVTEELKRYCSKIQIERESKANVMNIFNGSIGTVITGGKQENINGIVYNSTQPVDCNYKGSEPLSPDTDSEKKENSRPILLVTANKNETSALLEDREFFNYTSGNRSTLPEDILFYNIGSFGKYHVVHFELPEQGAVRTGASLLSIETAIRVYNPVAVILVGIAFGKDDEENYEEGRQRIGDVLVSTRMTDYESAKVKNGVLEPDGSTPDAGKHLISAFMYKVDTWQYDVDGKPAKVEFGQVLSGDKVVDDKEFKKMLLSLYPRAIGGEMEGRGAYSACRHHNLTEWIVVKAICDWADGSKGKDKQRRQETAVRSAVSLLKHVFSDEKVLEKIYVEK